MEKDLESQKKPLQKTAQYILSEKRLVKLAFLCPKTSQRKFYSIRKKLGVIVSISQDEDDKDSLITISSTEVVEFNSPTESASFEMCELLMDMPEKAHLKRLKVGSYRIRILGDDKECFEVDFVYTWTLITKTEICFIPRNEESFVIQETLQARWREPSLK
ncbi:unnamed protein product [Microthlaspi erraticum]|uniref:Uncharacterized protein n=1 Tax=Microthlaspi erraticum TaxID=1685480 RepID=A0A6D2KZA9_9BRAS|nr:unnamed protein product [Microthlaspi erraticum]